MTIIDRLLDRLAGPTIARGGDQPAACPGWQSTGPQAGVAAITEAVTDQAGVNTRWRNLADAGANDIAAADLRDYQSQSLEAYRLNPLAFRIVELMTDYVLGKGLTVEATPRHIHTFIQDFWRHPLNNMDARIHTLSTELSLSGEIFVTFHTNPYDAMTYVRAVPATLIDEIQTNPDDLEDEMRYHQTGSAGLTPDPGSRTPGRWWSRDDMHHYAVNRVIGATRGQGDLFPILPWLRRYKDWLTDRVVINKYKGAYLWDVTLKGATAAVIQQKKAELAAAPSAGSIMVHNDAETWQAVQPQIDAPSAAEDGLALRLMIAVGSGNPLHFLSEGAANSLATAKEMGEPTRRHYEKRQLVLKAIISDIIHTAVSRRFPARARGYDLELRFPDLTTSDNEGLAGAIASAVNAMATAVDRRWITDEIAASWLYKFAEERPPATTEEHNP